MKTLQKRGIAFLLAVMFMLPVISSSVPIYHAEAATIYVTRGQFLQMVATALKLLGADVTEESCIDAALDVGIITKKTFADFNVKLSRSDAAVVLVRADEYLYGETVDAELLQIVKEQRISDLSKVSTARQPFVVKCYALGYITGSSNGSYSTDRRFNPAGKISMNTAKLLVSRLTDPSKREILAPDGQLTRTKNLPSNADMYPYILDSFPNEYYDWKFHFMTVLLNWKYKYGDEEFDKDYIYTTPVDVETYFKNKYDIETINYIQNRLPELKEEIKKHLYTTFNVDYRTLAGNKKWYQDVYSTYGGYNTAGYGQTFSRIDTYIKDAIQNKTIVECDKVELDMSTFYFEELGYRVRVYVHYRVISSVGDPGTVQNELNCSPLIFSTDRFPDFGDIKIGKWQDGYFDVILNWFDWEGSKLGYSEIDLTSLQKND